MSQKNMKISIKQFNNWVINSIKHGAWAPITVFCIHVIAILILDVYSFFPNFDIPMHFVGGLAITFFFIESVISAKSNLILGNPSIVALIMMMFLLTCTTTIFWEFAEWIMDKLFLTHAQVSLDDTLLDMLLGILGGIVMIIIRFKNILKRT